MTLGMDLLPRAHRQSHHFKNLMARWLCVGVISGFAIAFIYVAARSELAEQHAELEILRQEELKVQNVMKSMEDFRSRIKEVTTIEQHLNGLHPSDDLLQTLGTISAATNQTTAASPPTLRKLSIDLADALQANGVSEENSSKPVSVKFEIVAMHEIPIHSALDSLRRHPRYRVLNIRSTSQDGERNLKRFEVEASVVVEKGVPK